MLRVTRWNRLVGRQLAISRRGETTRNPTGANLLPNVSNVRPAEDIASCLQAPDAVVNR
jgi:hypothetical protein